MTLLLCVGGTVGLAVTAAHVLRLMIADQWIAILLKNKRFVENLCVPFVTEDPYFSQRTCK